MPLRFLQTEFWASFKGEHGWKPYYFKAEGSSYTPIHSQSEIPFDEFYGRYCLDFVSLVRVQATEQFFPAE